MTPDGPLPAVPPSPSPGISAPTPALVRTATPEPCGGSEWENAYLRFETPEEEIAKFTRRLRRIGAHHWTRDARVVELFCGRGNGMVALERMGFTNVAGVDLSESLLRQYRGSARCYLSDCRALPFPDASQDRLIVQGGLHHLPSLPDDLRAVLGEARRVLVPGGLLVAVEPWQTPYLRLFLLAGKIRPLRRAWPRLDAAATMTEHELSTYTNWLSRPDEILALLREHFIQGQIHVGWGKLMFVGETPSRPPTV
jgi:SAM-dependent methyltransferase